MVLVLPGGTLGFVALWHVGIKELCYCGFVNIRSRGIMPPMWDSGTLVL